MKDAVDWSTIGKLLGVFVVVALLWRTPVVAPLKILVVLLHEISHGLAAVLTGGEISHIEVNANQGGVAYTRGGSRFAILSAGYLGSMFWGGVIVLLAARTRYDRAMSIGIGLAVGIITLLFIRSWFGFGFAIFFSIAMVAAGWKLSHDANELILKTIGVTSLLYAPLDIFDDVIARTGIGSDADKLAELTHLPSVLWGTIWIALSLAATAVFFYLSVRKPRAAAE